MTFEEDAKKVVARLAPGTEITDVKVGTQAVIVSTPARRWVIRDVTEGVGDNLSFRLYNASGPEVIDPPAKPDGVAMTEDGSLFHLNEAGDFHRFWRSVREDLSALDLAGLLSTYQSEAPAHETIVMGASDIEAESTSRHSIPPHIANAGPLMMTFVTQYFVEEPPEYEERRHLVEWSVREDDDGGLDWFWSPLRDSDV